MLNTIKKIIWKVSKKKLTSFEKKCIYIFFMAHGEWLIYWIIIIWKDVFQICEWNAFFFIICYKLFKWVIKNKWMTFRFLRNFYERFISSFNCCFFFWIINEKKNAMFFFALFFKRSCCICDLKQKKKTKEFYFCFSFAVFKSTIKKKM